MLYLCSMGHFHPDTVIDNAFLESLQIETNEEWILERVGIHERRSVLPRDYILQTKNQDLREAQKVAKYTASEMGAKAAQLALKRANLSPKEIGLVISGSCLPEMCIPSNACLVGAKLGIEAPAYDLNAACSSFMAHVDHLLKMRSETLPEYILIVVNEALTMATNYADRTTAVLWGDGAAAAILSPRVISQARILSTAFGSKPSDHDKVIIPYGGYFSQQGQTVQKFAILQTEATTKGLLEKAKVEPQSAFFIGHQANLRMLENCSQRIGVSIEKHLHNVAKFGNQGSAGAPSVLSQNWESFQPGDLVAMTAVGSGLSWGGMLIQFGDKT